MTAIRLVPGQTITVLEKLPFDGPIRVLVGGDEHLFGRPLAARINVVRPSKEERQG